MIVATKNPVRGLKIHMCYTVEDQKHDSKLQSTPLRCTFDSDSVTIRIDNHASVCMLDNPGHFVGPLIPMKRNMVKVIGWLLVLVNANETIHSNFFDNDG